jgi:hypothetical protein
MSVLFNPRLYECFVYLEAICVFCLVRGYMSVLFTKMLYACFV